MSDAKHPVDVNVKDSSASSVKGVSEYDEYLQLAEEFKGDRLRKTIRKVDLHLLPMLIFIYLLSYIDRTNVGNAKLFGALDDLGMSSQDWNTGLCVFFVTYSLGAVPANLALSRFGPKIWIPFILAMVSIILIIHGLVSNRGGWYTMRLLLGWFEAGVYPGCSYVLTTWYNTFEIQKRLTFFYSGACAAGAFSGLLAYGIGQLDYVWGYRGWRFIYVIEGLFTFCVACFAYFVVLPSPSESGKWLGEDERKFLVLRHKYSAGRGVAEKTNFDWKYARAAAKSPHTYFIGATQFSVAVAVYGLSFTIPTIMNNMGYSNAKSQAMSAPPYVFACFVTFASGWFADRYQQRMLAMVLPACLALAGYAIAVGTVSHGNLTGVTYLGIFFAAAGLYPISPACGAWMAVNSAGSMKRSVAIAQQVAIAQLGGLIGSNIYIGDESPQYPTGFGVSLAFLGAGNILLPIVYAGYVRWVNKKRDAMSEEEIRQKYSDEELAEMGDESPLFRYQY